MAFYVVCQIALRLVADELFVVFLRIVHSSIDKLLPGCGNTLRALVLEAFNKRKEHIRGVLARSVSKRFTSPLTSGRLQIIWPSSK